MTYLFDDWKRFCLVLREIAGGASSGQPLSGIEAQKRAQSVLAEAGYRWSGYRPEETPAGGDPETNRRDIYRQAIQQLSRNSMAFQPTRFMSCGMLKAPLCCVRERLSPATAIAASANLPVKTKTLSPSHCPLTNVGIFGLWADAGRNCQSVCPVGPIVGS
jgi:hypothetical protein